MVLAGRHRKVGDSFNAQLVPRRLQIVRLVKLHLVCHNAGAESLIRRILQVPARLVFLHVLSHDCTFLRILAASGHCVPNLEILGCVAVLIFAWTLPGDDVGP